MRQQIELLREVDWNALIVLDACRADLFQELVGQAEPVTSPACHTTLWLKAVAPVLRAKNVMYLTANPIVPHVARANRLELGVQDISQTHWGFFTAERIPSVHPMSLTAIALEMGQYVIDGHKLVVHYLQPHFPYIGAVPMAVSGNHNREDEMSKALRTLPNIHEMMQTGQLDMERLRVAYKSNLELVWDAARNLIDRLHGKIVVTGDHGELLGEHGHVGHRLEWAKEGITWPELTTVPWLELEGGGETGPTVEERLSALGYT